MSEYKCPYCGQDSYAKSSKNIGNYSNWNAVVKHLAWCKRNDHSIVFSSILGPLNKQYLTEYLKDIVEKTKIIPVRRDFTLKNGYLVDRNTVIQVFGTWNAFIESANLPTRLECNLNNCRTVSHQDKKLYKSALEAYFVDNFLFEKYQYEYEKPYGNGWFYDFYLPDLDLYIELDGGLRPQRIQEKIEFNQRLKRNFKVFALNDVYKKDFQIISVLPSEIGYGLQTRCVS